MLNNIISVFVYIIGGLLFLMFVILLIYGFSKLSNGEIFNSDEITYKIRILI
jgi:hypothetical protein